uniref:Uncharacterized protein n=1 Tax=Grammatophora oceanica TaxID=210454 RepID=A0A7S1Y454_9STRA|mmetsp:Transcript_17894/g.26534  ORF Transcript_17894/g.26534 Transcript_17894/m.26534 type:complete len:115 (+) Transcript_17894:102-446(+)
MGPKNRRNKEDTTGIPGTVKAVPKRARSTSSRMTTNHVIYPAKFSPYSSEAKRQKAMDPNRFSAARMRKFFAALNKANAIAYDAKKNDDDDDVPAHPDGEKDENADDQTNSSKS